MPAPGRPSRATRGAGVGVSLLRASTRRTCGPATVSAGRGTTCATTSSSTPRSAPGGGGGASTSRGGGAPGRAVCDTRLASTTPRPSPSVPTPVLRIRVATAGGLSTSGTGGPLSRRPAREVSGAGGGLTRGAPSGPRVRGRGTGPSPTSVSIRATATVGRGRVCGGDFLTTRPRPGVGPGITSRS